MSFVISHNIIIICSCKMTAYQCQSCKKIFKAEGIPAGMSESDMKDLEMCCDR